MGRECIFRLMIYCCRFVVINVWYFNLMREIDLKGSNVLSRNKNILMYNFLDE